jgi:hypothetical protein
MTQQEIQERNKEISLMLGACTKEMMGVNSWVLQENELNLSFDIFDEKLFSNDGGSGWLIGDLKFHSDWNWIMEAVEFICGTLGYRKYSYTHEEHSRCVFTDMAILFQKHDFGGGNIIIDSDKQKTEKEAVFIAVSDFAKLYNEEKL